MRTRTHLVTAALLTLAALVGAACSSGGSSAEGPSDFDPKAAAAAIRDLGAIRTSGEGSYGKQTGPIAGTIGYDPYRYRIRVSVSTGQILGEATIVRIGDEMWVDRSVLTSTDRAIPLGLGTLMFRASSSPPYLPLRNIERPFAAYLTYPFDPAALLDRVAETDATFRADGSSDVDGTDRKRFTAKLSVADARQIGVRALTVWVDADGVPVQVAFPTAAQGNVRYAIAPHQGTVRVQAPKDSAVQATGQPLPDATGPYTEVLTTTAGDIPIRVLQAPANLDWTCWKVESDPPFEGQNDPRPSGGTCAVPVEAGGLPEDQYAIPLGTTADAPYTLLGIVVPPGSTVEFRPFGSDPVTATAGPSGLALWAGTADQGLGLATITTSNATLVCGPGDIDNLVDFTAAERGGADPTSYRGDPWNCLEQDLADALSD